MAREISAVLEYGTPEPGEIATMMEDKLRSIPIHWDLSVDLRAGLSDIVVIDARSLRCIRRWPHPWRRQLPTSGDECRDHRSARPQ
jgi:hypothetical protein